jgi:O-acetyl-ADP-ribose deacetylase (regulator of RNase III)
MVTYVKGDATKPQGDGRKIIAHVCNDKGGWGAGFVLALNRLSYKPQKLYREWYARKRDYFLPLGGTQTVYLNDELYVFNMVAQHGTVSKLNPQPLSYEALEIALERLAELAIELGASVHMPRIGAGLAGGDWNVIESIINRTLTLRDVNVTVYDFAQ